MSVVNELFQEYINMRENGMSSKDTLNALRSYITPLSKSIKKPLADAIKTWERNAKETQSEESADANIQNGDAAAEQLQDQDVNWLECPSCNKKNRVDAVFCFSCGLLMDVSSQLGTKHFTDSLVQDLDYFSMESVLVIRAAETNHEYELRPQHSKNGLLVGRCSANNAITPDIDLSEAYGESLGVSRLHLSIKYSADDEAIEICDLSSVNGSFVNGQKLQPKVIRILRGGDKLKLGKLILWVDFFHPGNEISG